MFRILTIAAALLLAPSFAAAVPPFPTQLPGSPGWPRSPIEGVWYFRGDPDQPAYIHTVQTPFGPLAYATNEKGSTSRAEISPNGRRIFVHEWNIEGRLYGRRLVWPNGDFWAR